MRIGSVTLIKNIEFSNVEESQEAEIGGNGSYLGTFDYYFNQGGSSFVAFVGFGYLDVSLGFFVGGGKWGE